MRASPEQVIVISALSSVPSTGCLPPAQQYVTTYINCYNLGTFFGEANSWKAAHGSKPSPKYPLLLPLFKGIPSALVMSATAPVLFGQMQAGRKLA